MPNIDVSIDYQGKIKATDRHDFKQKVTDLFNNIAADVRNQGGSIDNNRFSWLAQSAIASLPEENLEALKKDLAPKGFDVQRYIPRQIVPE